MEQLLKSPREIITMICNNVQGQQRYFCAAYVVVVEPLIRNKVYAFFEASVNKSMN